MYDVVAELAGELVATALAALGALALTGLGLVVELNAVTEFGAGHLVTTVWSLALGAVLLYVGVYLVGYQTVLARDAA
jgi:hypothetical protein